MKGFVTLLGAGPGDVELLTIKGQRRLREADVLVYDRLVNKDLLKLVPNECEKINVGKQPGFPSAVQEDIENILIKKAQEGKKVVRLKSGDPYVFGRGGEEAQALYNHGINYEVIPGLSSAIAGLTFAGIPITFRDVATSFHIFTGHLKDENEFLNWKSISKLKGTMVFLMGMKNLSMITSELMKHGYSGAMPVAIIEWATHPQQRSIVGTLETIVSIVEKHQFKAPSLIVVGEVIRFRDQLNFHESLPLFGKRILLQESSENRLATALKDYGAEIIHFLKPETQELDFILPNFKTIDTMIFTEEDSWLFFIKNLSKEGIDLRLLSYINITAIGHRTARVIKKYGIVLKAEYNYFEEMIDNSREVLNTNRTIIYTSNARAEDIEMFRNARIVLTHQINYSQTYDNLKEEINLDTIDCICLPNAKAAKNLFKFFNGNYLDDDRIPVIHMGSNTKKVLQSYGLKNLHESLEPSVSSVILKCIELLN